MISINSTSQNNHSLFREAEFMPIKQLLKAIGGGEEREVKSSYAPFCWANETGLSLIFTSQEKALLKGHGYYN